MQQAGEHLIYYWSVNQDQVLFEFDCDIPDSLDSKQIETLKSIIPPISDKEETDNYHEIEEVTEEEMDSFYYNPDEDEEDEEEDDEY